MSEERRKAISGTTGRFERADDDQAIRARDAEWNRILKEEQKDAYEKRKRRVTMVFGLLLTTAAMIGFIEYGQISYILAMCFNAVLAAVFGYHIK